MLIRKIKKEVNTNWYINLIGDIHGFCSNTTR